MPGLSYTAPARRLEEGRVLDTMRALRSLSGTLGEIRQTLGHGSRRMQ